MTAWLLNEPLNSDEYGWDHDWRNEIIIAGAGRTDSVDYYGHEFNDGDSEIMLDESEIYASLDRLALLETAWVRYATAVNWQRHLHGFRSINWARVAVDDSVGSARGDFDDCLEGLGRGVVATPYPTPTATPRAVASPVCDDDETLVELNDGGEVCLTTPAIASARPMIRTNGDCSQDFLIEGIASPSDHWEFRVSLDYQDDRPEIRASYYIWTYDEDGRGLSRALRGDDRHNLRGIEEGDELIIRWHALDINGDHLPFGGEWSGFIYADASLAGGGKAALLECQAAKIGVTATSTATPVTGVAPSATSTDLTLRNTPGNGVNIDLDAPRLRIFEDDAIEMRIWMETMQSPSCRQTLYISNWDKIALDEYESIQIDFWPDGDMSKMERVPFVGSYGEVSGGRFGDLSFALGVQSHQRGDLRHTQRGVKAAWRFRLFEWIDSSQIEVARYSTRIMPDESILDGGHSALVECLHEWDPAPQYKIAIAAKDAELARLGDALAAANLNADRARELRDAAIAAKDAMAETLRRRSEAYQARIDQLRESNRRLQDRINDLRARLRGR